jgi:hypothetical protein
VIAIRDGALTVTRHGRTVQLQAITDESYFHALRAFGARESVAAAASKGLITVKVGTR